MIDEGKEELSSMLMSLVNIILKKLNQYQENGSLQFVKKSYSITRIKKLNYDKGINRVESYLDSIVKDEWLEFDRYKKIEEFLSTLIESKTTIDAISNKYQLETKKAKEYLKSFIVKLTIGFPSQISNEKILKVITNFIRDLEGGELNIELEAWLQGVWLEVDQLVIGDRIILRKPRTNDFELEMPMDYFPSFYQNLFSLYPAAILSIKSRAKSNIQIQDELEIILMLLKLFKLGSVFACKYDIRNDSIINMSFVSHYSNKKYTSQYKYGIFNNEVVLLNKFYQSLHNKLKIILCDHNICSSYLKIAISRYSDSINGSDSNEKRIAFAISCLESLFLKKNEESELSHRLAQRVAILLKVYKYNPIEVYNKITKAYKIRSVFIHGSLIDTEEKEAIKKLANVILDYTRICLIIHIQISDNLEKDYIINKLDHSTLDYNSFDKLNNLLNDIVIT